MTQEVKFVIVTDNDIKELQEISRTTYYDAFAWGNTLENMTKYLDNSFSEHKLLKELNDADSKFYFAKHHHQTVGYFKVNVGKAQTDLKEQNGMELERIYVLKEHQRKKIGEAIIAKAIELALGYKVDYVWLGVWYKNEKAVSFYERNRFKPVGTHSFMMGDEAQVDLIMKRHVT